MCFSIFNLKAEALFFNCLCCVGGVIKIGSCIANMKYANGLSGFYWVLSLSRILLGCSIFVVALYGFYGMLGEYVKALWLYVVFLTILTLCKIAIILILVYSDTYITGVIVRRIYEVETLGTIETAYRCCGKTGVEDYTKSHMAVPRSCYSHDPFLHKKVLARDGCDTKLQEYFHQKKMYTLLLFCIFAVVQILSILVTIRLANRLSKWQKIQQQQIEQMEQLEEPTTSKKAALK